MPAKKPSTQEVMDALHTLSVGMGAELVSLRAEVEKLSQTIVGLSHMLANVASPPKFYSGVEVKLPKPIYTEDDIYKACYPLNASEKQAAEHGHLIDAIKAYRSRIKNLTDVTPDLKASKDLVQAHMNATPGKSSFNILSPPLLLESHKAFVKLGQKIDAIKAYREYTKEVCLGYASLKEAKDIMDAYAFSIGASNWTPQITFLQQPW